MEYLDKQRMMEKEEMIETEEMMETEEMEVSIYLRYLDLRTNGVVITDAIKERLISKTKIRKSLRNAIMR